MDGRRTVRRLAMLVIGAGAVVAVVEVLPAKQSDARPTGTAEAVYFGGPILTMEGVLPRYVEAIAVKGGKIVFAGEKSQALALRVPGTRILNLGGRTLLPGFIDAHGHVWSVGLQKLAANLSAPPDGGVKDLGSLVRALQDWRQRNAEGVSAHGWVVGFGYDEAQLSEQRHPEADDLDEVADDVPVLVVHRSGHLAVMNHKALELAGTTADTRDPAGGVIRRGPDGRAPSGVLEEMAFYGPVSRLFATLEPDANEKIALAGLAEYVTSGFTTGQEGRATAEVSETWRKLGNDGRLAIDVVAYPDIQSQAEYMKTHGVSRAYESHFRVGGVKLGLDGSLQGRTAWLTKPYAVPPPGKSENYAGYPAIMDPSVADSLVTLAFKNGWQVLAHCNGDAAGDEFIDAVEIANAATGGKDRRPVMLHAQTVREDQLDSMKTLGILPSFFSMQAYYWGDADRDESLGRERASRLSPTGSAMRREMKFTEHHDAPVALPSAVMILHATVNRTSRRGDVIGIEQRVSPYVALKSITDWAAYQYFEDDRKGTLTPGKLADFVILDRDPLKVDPKMLKDIRVLETIKEGKTVFRAE